VRDVETAGVSTYGYCRERRAPDLRLLSGAQGSRPTKIRISLSAISMSMHDAIFPSTGFNIFVLGIEAMGFRWMRGDDKIDVHAKYKTPYPAFSTSPSNAGPRRDNRLMFSRFTAPSFVANADIYGPGGDFSLASFGKCII